MPHAIQHWILTELKAGRTPTVLLAFIVSGGTKMKKQIAIFGFLLAISSPAFAAPVTAPVTLHILHTNDIHSHLRAPQTEPFGLGGLAKLSTLLTQLRSQSPNSITLDAGDWSEGTWYYDLDEGANMLRMLTAMKYDAVCLGNHDFFQGPDQLIKTIRAADPSFPVLAANLDMSAYPNAVDLLTAIPQTFIKTVGGVRVGIIGLTTNQATYRSYLEPVEITDNVDAASALATTMRPNVDVLIILSHNDFTDNETIAQKVPGVDVVISGHSHVKTSKAVMVTNDDGRRVPVVETGAWGEYLGDLKLTVDLKNHHVAMASYELHPVTPDLAEDTAIAAIIASQDHVLNSKFNLDIDEVVAESDVNLLQADTKESLLGNLAVQSYRYATGADVAIEEVSMTGVSIAKGNVTVQNLHDVIPHMYNPATGKEWTLNVWNALGSDLKLVAQVFYIATGLMPQSSPLDWLSMDNAEIDWNPAALIPGVHSIQIGGQDLDPDARYKVALTDGLLFALQTESSKFYAGIDFSQLTNTGIEAWRAVMAYAKSLSI